MTHAWLDDDPVARDGHGAALSAGELCHRDGCWHRWLDHDHITAGLSDAWFGWCMILSAEGRCGCLGFIGGST